MIKYGILINYSQIFHTFFGNTSIWPTISSYVLLHMFVACSYLIELKLVKVSFLFIYSFQKLILFIVWTTFSVVHQSESNIIKTSFSVDGNQSNRHPVVSGSVRVHHSYSSSVRIFIQFILFDPFS